MKGGFLIIIAAVLFCCCNQTNTTDKNNFNSLNNKISKDSNKLSILKTHYVLLLKGQKHIVRNQQELIDLFTHGYSKKDSLYVFIEDNTDNVADAMKSLRISKVDKYRIIVSNDFFKLPYPK